jgi:hypothetical protein
VPDARFEEVKSFIRSGAFGDYDYSELLGSLEGDSGFGRGDYFLVGHDFPAYIECQDKVDEAYRDQQVCNPTPWPFEVSTYSCLQFCFQVFGRELSL